MPDDKAAEIRAAAPRFYERVGFACGPGWTALLKMLGRAAENVDASAQALLVKEKFGMLRVYVGGMNSNAAFIAVDAAESMSATICERCGKAGALRGDGWMRTLCDGCDDWRRASA